MFKEKFKIPMNLSFIIIILAFTASAGGLFLGDIYRDSEFIKNAWQGNDIVTLFIVVPIMLGSLLLSICGSLKAQLIWMGTLWYMVYNYMFYLYAAAFNVFFLIYVALLTLALYALIFAFIKVDVKKISSQFRKSTPVKLISGYMLFFAVFLGSLWIIRAVNFIITGQVPQDIIKTGHPTAVVYATDLSLLIPALVMSAILLWRREPWGYVLSAVVMIKSVTYSLVLIIMSIVGYLRMGEGDSMISLWIFLSVTCLFALGFLLGNMNSLNILKEEK